MASLEFGQVASENWVNSAQQEEPFLKGYGKASGQAGAKLRKMCH